MCEDKWKDIDPIFNRSLARTCCWSKSWNPNLTKAGTEEWLGTRA